jgi:hypothetical protein
MLRILAFLLMASLFTTYGCEERPYIYEVNDIDVEPNNSGKNKEKSQEQFINIAYANLYQRPLSPNQLVDVSNVITSIGDKQVAYETIIAKMMGDPNISIPTSQEMRDDVEGFVLETYKRFFVRIPTEAEKTFFINFIESNPNVTPELVYFSFATSNEYYFY